MSKNSQPTNQPLSTVSPINEMDKAIRCLALELPAEVWEDVNKRWQRVKATPPATVINFDLREVQQWINNELIKLGGQHKHGAKEDDEYYLGKWAAFDEVRIYLSNSPQKNIQPLQWVKASERLPEINGFYIVRENNGTVREIKYYPHREAILYWNEKVKEWLESTPTNQPKEISDELSGEPIKIDVIKEIESCFQLTATPVTPNQLSGIELWINDELKKLGDQHKHGAKEDDEYYQGKYEAFDKVRRYLSTLPPSTVVSHPSRMGKEIISDLLKWTGVKWGYSTLGDAAMQKAKDFLASPTPHEDTPIPLSGIEVDDLKERMNEVITNVLYSISDSKGHPVFDTLKCDEIGAFILQDLLTDAMIYDTFKAGYAASEGEDAIKKVVIEELSSILSSGVHAEYLPELINDRISELKGHKQEPL